MRIDHVAIEVADFDARLALLTSTLGLELRRTGRLVADSSRRIAMLADERGVKVELVEADPHDADVADRLLHLAFDTADTGSLATTFAGLLDAGWSTVTAPRRFEPARSHTATVEHGGATVQLVTYDADSPDAGDAP